MRYDKDSVQPPVYVDPNIVIEGKGPTRWVASTCPVHEEMFGAATYGALRSFELSKEPEEPGQPVSDVEELLAVIAASDKSNVQLTNDLVLTSTLSINRNKDVKINLNGKTITANNTAAIQVIGGKLTLEGGSMTGSQRSVVVTDGGEAIINSGTYTSTRAGQVMSVQGNGSSLIINNGTFNSQESGAMAFDGATLEINGGTFNTIDNFAIGTNGTENRGKNTIIINKATINANISSDGYEACGIYIPNDDNVTIGKNVVINVINGCGILMRGGKVTVEAGVKINLTTNKPDGFTGWVGDNKTKMTQTGIIYHETANYPGKAGMELIVKDGVTIKGIDHSIEILSNEENPQVTIGIGNYNPVYPEN